MLCPSSSSSVYPISRIFSLHYPHQTCVFPYLLELFASIGAICKYWREIAWSTPCLWSSLVVRVKPNRCDSQTDIVQEWLARSGHLPLSIRIFTTVSTPQIGLAVLALADIINQYSARWFHLDLSVPQNLCQYFHAIDNHAPVLKSIRLNWHSFEEYNHSNNTERFRLTCPRLQQAFFSLYRLHDIDIRLDNLTHLYLENLCFSDYLVILRETSQLVFFSFTGRNSVPWDRLPETLILRSLRSLRIQIMNCFAQRLLLCLSLPRLEELSLGVSRNFDPVKPIISLIKKSACSLCSFAVIESSGPTGYKLFMIEDSMDLLQLMPSLKKLSITVTPSLLYNPRDYLGRWNILLLLVNALSSQKAKTIHLQFLPNLEILEYTGKLCLRSGNYAELYPLPPVDNDVRGSLRLIKLDLYPAIRIPIDAISFFLSLVERGLTVNIYSRSQDILQSSIHHYRGREGRFRQDWVDDLDLSLIQDLS